jgi:hypothetical protein
VNGDRKEADAMQLMNNNQITGLCFGGSMAKQIGSILLLGMLVFSLILTTAYGKDDISVTCYRGDPSEDRRVGEVAVFNVNSARGNCNVLYYDCEGNCTPCYADEDSRVICIDSSGNPYYL